MGHMVHKYVHFVGRVHVAAISHLQMCAVKF
jgi:hypothetical protein